MGQFLLLVVVALTVGAVVFGVTVLLTGGDKGLSPAEPDGRAVPLPGTRPLSESDLAGVRFDVAARGYRMAQVDQAMRRAAYDIGYKDELINVLEAEVDALRSGRFSDAEVLRRAREAAQAATANGPEATNGPEAASEPAAANGPGATGGAETPAGADQQIATINLGMATKASTGEPGATGTGQPAGPRAGADGTEGLAGSRAESDGTAEPAGPRADAGGDGDGSDRPEPDSIMPGHR